VQGMAAKLVDDLRRDKVELVSKSHSTISVESCAQLLGMSREEAVARCQSLGWAIEGDFIKPVKSTAVMPQLLNPDELQALTGARCHGLPCAFAAAQCCGVLGVALLEMHQSEARDACPLALAWPLLSFGISRALCTRTVALR